MKHECIQPNWSVSNRINAFSTTRLGGVSKPPYDQLNLGLHVGDNPDNVKANRQRLRQGLSLPAEPKWLSQEHTTSVQRFDRSTLSYPIADAAWTAEPGVVLAVMTADCVPILITNRTATLVAVVHAGWKGLAAGVVEKTVDALPEKASELVAWVGPCISQTHFEVGEDVYTAFKSRPYFKTEFFKSGASENKWWANLPGLVDSQLAHLGVGERYLSGLCTFADADTFFSYRRDGITGRMASLIWMDK